MIKEEKFSTTCTDGVQLKGLLLIPEKPKAVVQFNCGTAAKKEFYKPFLSYLAAHGYVCALWDYRGSGESAPKDLVNCDFTFRDYGIKDMPAIKSYLRIRFSQLPFFIFGHSAGGQQLGMMDDLSDVKAMLGFAVSTGYAPYMPFSYRLQSNFFFYLFSPISILLTGYIKAKPFKIMENLPANVVLEWKAWCAKKDYLFDDAFYGKTVPKGHYENMPFPIHIFWTPDDTIANERNSKNFWSHVHSDHGINFTKVEAIKIGEKEIGHFGFFKRRMKDKLWGLALEKLDSFLD